MSISNPSTAPVPAAHKKMIADCIAKGWIKRVGDSYEITPEGYEYTRATQPANSNRRLNVALTVILTCVVIINALNLILVMDLHGRSRTLAKAAHDASFMIVGITHLLRKVTEEKDETI